MRLELSRVAEAVRMVFGEERRAIVVTVFGSVVRRGLARDVDVAVYSRGFLSLRDLLLLGARLEEVLGVSVDVVPLEDAPPLLAFKALVEGVPVVVRDHAAFTELVKRAIGDAWDLSIKGVRYATLAR